VDGFFLIQGIGSVDPPIRFAVEAHSKQRRIFSYFPIGTDGSVGVQDYFPADSTMMRTFDKPPPELSTEERSIRKGAFELEAQSFRPQKFSFHQSGVANAKSRTGQRFVDDTDAHSIPFAQIKDSIRLCYIYPANYEKYPERTAHDGKHHNVFELNEAISTMPSMVELRLARDDFNLEDRLRQAYTGFAAFRDVTTLRSFGLVIYTIFRRSPNTRFPTHHAFIAEKY
jgi:hypothetical protein